MADFNIRSEAVDVEQIMKQIRARVREKRGVDYTEDQIRELATVRLEKFLDPKNLRSDLLEQFRRSRPALPSEPPPVEPPYEFNDQTLFATHRGALRFVRRLLKPVLKLFFNPNPLINVLHTQAQFNVDLLKREQRRRIEFDRSRAEWNALYYEVLHNLVLETTRSGIEIKNLKMRVEALASRLDFSERRVRALEGVVQYRPEVLHRADRIDREQRVHHEDTEEEAAAGGGEGEAGATPAVQAGEGRRRRRRRRGRRGSAQPTAGMAEGHTQEEPLEGDTDEGHDTGGPSERDTSTTTIAAETGVRAPQSEERAAAREAAGTDVEHPAEHEELTTPSEQTSRDERTLRSNSEPTPPARTPLSPDTPDDDVQ